MACGSLLHRTHLRQTRRSATNSVWNIRAAEQSAALSCLRLLRGWFVGLWFGGGWLVDVAGLVVFGDGFAHQPFVEPSGDVVEALDAVPGFSGAGELVGFAGEADHDGG